MNHSGQVEKNLLGPAGIFLYLSGMVCHSEKHLIIILYPSSLSHNNHLSKFNLHTVVTTTHYGSSYLVWNLSGSYLEKFRYFNHLFVSSM